MWTILVKEINIVDPVPLVTQRRTEIFKRLTDSQQTQN